MSVEDRLAALGLTLPHDLPLPAGAYLPVRLLGGFGSLAAQARDCGAVIGVGGLPPLAARVRACSSPLSVGRPAAGCGDSPLQVS